MPIRSAFNFFREHPMKIRRLRSRFLRCFSSSSTSADIRDQEIDSIALGANGQETDSGKNSFKSVGRIGGRWKRGKLLGKGECGEVFQAVDTETGEEVAVKMEPIWKNEFWRTLPNESDVYRALNESSNTTGFAKMHFYGRSGDRNALVMTRLGRSLEDLLEFCGGTFSAKTVLMFGIQAVTRIEQLHDEGYAHVTIHPGNVLIGEKDPNTIYLVDFGCAYKLSAAPAVGGSGLRQTDMQDLGDVLKVISNAKIAYWFGFLCKRANLEYVPEVAQFVREVKGLSFDEKFDYEYMRAVLRAGLRRRNLTDDGMFDWMGTS